MNTNEFKALATVVRFLPHLPIPKDVRDTIERMLDREGRLLGNELHETLREVAKNITRGERELLLMYRALLDLAMVSDPWPLTADEGDLIEGQLNAIARARGFHDYRHAARELPSFEELRGKADAKADAKAGWRIKPPTLLEDGRIRYWSVYELRHVTAETVPDRELAAMPPEERDRCIAWMRGGKPEPEGCWNCGDPDCPATEHWAAMSPQEREQTKLQAMLTLLTAALLDQGLLDDRETH